MGLSSRTPEEFAADLNQITTQAVQAAAHRNQVNALTNAANRGDEAEARRIASSMSTEDLQRLKKQLES